MPELSDVLDQVEIELPAQERNVPVREGEERFAAGLTLEDSRRRDAMIVELTEQLKRLQGTSAGETHRFGGGQTAKRRRMAAMKKVAELKALTKKRGDRWEGPAAPYTIINLNPDPLCLQGELQRWSVPAAGKGLPVALGFRGRKFVGSYLTISTPHIYPAHTGTQNDKQTGADMPAVEYLYIPPAGLVHQFYEHFVEGANDAQGMGGVVIFEGDIHTLDAARLERNDGQIWVPRKEITLDGQGDVVYTSEPRLLVDCLEAAVTVQRNYADKQVAEGHSYSSSQSDIIRNQLSEYHRRWHNFALGMGYLEKALPWAVDQLRDTPTTQVVNCPDCHQRQDSPEQYFCRNCNAPFDALKAFLAGKMVSPDRLTVYEGEEWDAIVTEMERRKAKVAILEAKPRRARSAAEQASTPAAEPAAEQQPED